MADFGERDAAGAWIWSGTHRGAHRRNAEGTVCVSNFGMTQINEFPWIEGHPLSEEIPAARGFGRVDGFSYDQITHTRKLLEVMGVRSVTSVILLNAAHTEEISKKECLSSLLALGLFK